MELTEQQLKDLYLKGNEGTKRQLDELNSNIFHDFNKWHISDGLLYCPTKLHNGNYLGYGFDNKDRFYTAYIEYGVVLLNDYWVYNKRGRLATHEEVETALINEAKKRGFKMSGNEYYSFGSNKLFSRERGNGGDVIFDNGKWAEVIEPKEEKPNVLDYLDDKEVSEMPSDILFYSGEIPKYITKQFTYENGDIHVVKYKRVKNKK